MMRQWTAIVCVILGVASHAVAGDLPPVRLEQSVSREHPAFDCANAVMTVGKDGVVYLSNMIHDGTFVMRIERDGSGKLGALTGDAAANATANSTGVIATPNA